MDETVDFGPQTVSALQKVQLERLRRTVSHAYARGVHYRRVLDGHGVAPSDLRSLEDLARFPFTTKADFRDNYPFGMFAVPMQSIARLHASSGTTGQPTVVGYTAGDLRTWAGLVARSIHAAGGRPGMKVHIAYGYGLFTGGLGAHYGAEALGCTVIPMSGGQTGKQVQMIQDFAPEIIMVTPSYMLAILDEFRRRGLDPSTSSLRYGLFGAEPWTEAMRREIEHAFSMQASDIYGLSELMGPGVAAAFVGDPIGPTVWEDHFYPEIVDPDTGHVLPDGEQGELVLTSLTREAMPILRYRTRDLTRLMPGNGSPMRRLARIVGRSDDMMIVRGVNLFPSQIEEMVIGLPALSPHFEIEISRLGRLDTLLVRVEPRFGAGGDDAALACRHLAARIKDLAGVSADVRLEPANSIARSAGKAARVQDLRGALHA
ncbi:MAG: AMP-binding protein [Sphingomonas sp.]|uniref:AMP-binding protein n=1 Tax=Sphingomonas sp. TaxID=28214 RepID=UPI003569D0D9